MAGEPVPPLAPIMALVGIVAIVPYLALQMRGAGHVLEVLTGGAISVEAGAALVYGVVLVYVWRSGVMGVGWTNTLQGAFMMVLAWVLGLYLPRHARRRARDVRVDGARAADLARRTTSGAVVVGGVRGTILVMTIGFSFWPHLFQKAFAARSEAVLRRTVVLYPTFQLFLLPILLIGFAGVGMDPPPSQPDQVLPHILLTLDLPAAVVGLFCAGALAASMSSGDALPTARPPRPCATGGCGAQGVSLARGGAPRGAHRAAPDPRPLVRDGDDLPRGPRGPAPTRTVRWGSSRRR